MIEFFLSRRVLTNLITLFIVAVGGWQFATVRREAFPEFGFDIVTIATSYPGASPEEVERLLTRKVEEPLRELAGIDRVESYSLEHQSIVVLRLDEDLREREKDRVLTEVYQAVSRIEDLPELAEKPAVAEMTSNRPLLTLSVAGGEEDARERFAKEMKDILEALPGVSRVAAEGSRDREISIEADRRKLAAARITLGEIASAVKARNVDLSAGSTVVGPRELWVRVTGAVSTAEQVGAIILRGNDERSYLRVRDLARVSEGLSERRVAVRAGGLPAVELQVSKHKSGDTIKLARAVRRAAAEEEPRAKALGLTLIFSDDQSFFINRRLKVMTNNMIQGGLLILGALFLFLDWRLAVVAAWGVPISFAAAMMAAVPLGFTINLMSMLAFILVLGMLDDDSVVVAENIYRHLERGKPPLRAAVEGTREVALPVIGSILVSSCAFLPFAMVTGIMGKFLVMIPIVVVLAFAASVFEALFILPAHVLDLLPFGRPVEEGSGDERGWFAWVVAAYRAAISWVLRYRGRFALLLAGFLALTAGLAAWRVKLILFPPGLIDQFFIQLDMPRGSSLAETERAFAEIERAALSLPPGELEALTGLVGRKGFEETRRTATRYAQARVFLTPEEGRGRKTRVIMAELRAKLAKIPGAERVLFEELRPGPPVGSAVLVRARGRDPEVLGRIVDRVRAALAEIPGVRDLRDSREGGKDEWRLVLDEREAAFSGLDVARVARELFYAVDGGDLSRIQRPDEEVKIRLRLLPGQRSRPEELLALEVLNLQGRPVTLGRIGSIVTGQGAPVLIRYNFQPAVSITADVNTEVNTSREANASLQERFKDIGREFPGYELIYGGEEEQTRKSMSSLFRAFGTALLLDLVVLAALFGSYAQPFLIMLTIPIGLIGVVYALILHGEPASFMALLGVVAMTGVVVNNAIVLVNFINDNRAKGLSAAEAAVEAGATRLRAIGASSITTLLGLFPTAYGFGGYEPFVAPMALALAWGLTFAMPMTVFLIPAAYVLLDDLVQAARRLFWRATLPPGGGQSPAALPRGEGRGAVRGGPK